jgi:hypothetical protein
VDVKNVSAVPMDRCHRSRQSRVYRTV